MGQFIRNYMLDRISSLCNRAANGFDHLSKFSRKQKSRTADYRRHRSLVRRNNKINGSLANQRAFIIGTGPSLKLNNLQFLEDEITFAVNGFWTHPINRQYAPSFYCLLDSLFFGDEPEAKSLLCNIKDAVRGTRFILPASLASRHFAVSDLVLDPIFVSFSGEIEKLNSIPNLAYDIPIIHNVVQFALAAAMYMKCNPIYLIGCDHNFVATSGLLNHFHGGNSVDIPLSTPKMEETFDKAGKVWRGYRRLRCIAERNGIEIYNATYGGELDVFDRKNFDDLFSIN